MNKPIRTIPLLAALLAVCLCVPAPAGARVTPFIVGGHETALSQVPWQVLIVVQPANQDYAITCGGSIIAPGEILTAAHCVTEEGTTTRYPTSEIVVFAGLTNDSEIIEDLADGGEALPSGTQLQHVASMRVHPYFMPTGNVKDDVAVLTLEHPFTISAAQNTAVIGLVAEGQTPAPGSELQVSGFGKEAGAESAAASGALNSTTLTAIGSDACRDTVAPNSAVLLCAQAPGSTTCQGDSGGALTQGSPAVEVGIVDFGEDGCPVGRPAAFTNVAAPEIREFIEGSEAPQIAPRIAVAPAIRSAAGSYVDDSPITCEAGSWSGAPSLTFTFQSEGASPQVLQSGTSNVLVPASGAVGLAITCIVQAANAGGVSTERTATTPPLTLDDAPPSARILGRPRCRRRSCTLLLAAGDPNSVALSVRASVSYRLPASCRVRVGGRELTRRCERAHSRSVPVQPTTGGYRAAVTGLPYGVRLTFSVRASDAAGLRQSRAATANVLLRRGA